MTTNNTPSFFKFVEQFKLLFEVTFCYTINV